MTEQDIVKRIADKKKELETAGYIHGRDLQREIKRLEKELMTYRYYQKQARKRLPA